MDWLLPLGIGLCRVIFAWQLRSDWIRDGLTWVRWRTLVGLALGSACLALWGVEHRSWSVLAVGGLPGVLDGWLAWLKLRDLLLNRRHTRDRPRR